MGRAATKYEPLEVWLREFRGSRVTLAYAEVEGIIGARLPHSSYAYQAHWQGRTAGRPGGAIAAAGWHVEELDHMGRSITLRRGGKG